MKKYFYILLFSFVCTNAIAQQFDWDDPRINWDWDHNRHSFSISAGYNSLYGIGVKKIVKAISDESGNANMTINRNNPLGHYGFQYHYNVLEWLRLGTKITNDVNRITNDSITNHLLMVNVMFSTQFTYYNKPRWRVYSGIDVGAAMLIDVGTKVHNFLPALNITPIGFSYGRGFYVFVETNLGADSLIKGGIGLRM